MNSKLLSKWLNLAIFVFIDFSTVALIMSTTIQAVPLEYPGSIFGFLVVVKVNPLVILLAWSLTIIFRFLVMLIYLRRILKSRDIACLYDTKNPYEIPFSVQVSFSSSGIPLEELHQIILQQIKIFNLNVDKVYVNISGMPNVFTLVVPIPRMTQRIVVLNSNILRLLSPREIEAMFIQEIAHMHTSNSTLKLIATGPRALLTVAYYYVYLRILVVALNYIVNLQFMYFIVAMVFLIAIALLFRILELMSLGFLQRSNRAGEHLADAEMVKLKSKVTSISMLNKVGLRLSTIYSFYEEVIWLQNLERNPLVTFSRLARSSVKVTKKSFIDGILDYFPTDILDPTKSRLEAPRIFLQWRVKQLNCFKVKFAKKESKEIIMRAAQSLQEEREAYIATIKKKDAIPFSVLRQRALEKGNINLPKVIPGKEMQFEECQSLVDILEKNVDVATTLYNEELLPGGSEKYPPIEKRILFIWNLPLEKVDIFHRALNKHK